MKWAPALCLILLSCEKQVGECSENVPCTGFGETCVKGKCEAQSCANNSQCGMEQYCEDGSCASGCTEDTDCYPDSFCNTEKKKCEASGCRSTTLDCDFQQFCDVSTGECYDASGYYCRECLSDEECGGNGNTCLSWGIYGSFCGVTCETETDCPSGYNCIGLTDSSGNVVSKQCITYCWLYGEDP
jgi:hypothetical protein